LAGFQSRREIRASEKTVAVIELTYHLADLPYKWCISHAPIPRQPVDNVQISLQADQLDELVGRKPSLIENALERAAFETFAMEGNRHDTGTAGMAKISI
jgi:hypothetical protein